MFIRFFPNIGFSLVEGGRGRRYKKGGETEKKMSWNIKQAIKKRERKQKGRTKVAALRKK